MASPPVAAKLMAACTLGSMLPGANWSSAQYCSAWAMVIISRSFWPGLPQLMATRSTAVRMTSLSAPTSSASLALAKSLSMTAGTPTRRPSRRTTGMPPPPTVMTT